MKFNDFIVSEEKVRLDPKCWTGKKIGNPKTKMKGGVRVNNCVPAESINEDSKRCMQCGMVNCSCPGDSCKCKPIKGWIPGKGFKKAIDEAANAAQQAAIAIAKKKKAGVDEAAPPGAKAERMVKHIKKGYAKDGKLSDKEKSIAYATAWKAHNKGVTEGSQRVDSLVTDALKIMQGSEASDAVAALKTVLGDREYNSRRGYYNFYVRQLLDMSGQKGVTEDDAGDVEQHMIAKIEKEKQRLAKLKQTDPEAYKREMAKSKTSSKVPPVSTFEDQGVAEGFNGEYDDEAGMAQGNLYTIAQAAQGLLDTIDDRDNLPEWAQEKIAKVEGMLVSVWNYLQSQKAQGIDPEINEMYEAMDQLAEEMAAKKGISADLVWESFEALDDNMLYETAAWRRKEGKSKKGGLNAKGVASYRRENPGSKLQTAVTTKPSKLKPGSKAAKRRKSFCARMSGVKGPAKKPNGEPTRKTLALRKWNC